jgi:hypothetical protein
LEIHVNGKLQIEGNLHAFTNPAIEVGLVHCRALLEFLGLTANSGRIVNINRRRPSDIGIEHFSNASGHLSMVSPDTALSRYDGGNEDAETALLAVFQITNKGIAHVTEDICVMTSRTGPDHPAAEISADLATGTTHALQAVLETARLSVQARPSGAAAAQQGHNERRRRAVVSRRSARSQLKKDEAMCFGLPSL